MSVTTKTKDAPRTTVWRYPAVSSEQAERCSPFVDLHARSLVWMVQSESDPLTEYKVSWLEIEQAVYLICTCPAGQNGRYCKHKRWVLVAQSNLQAEIRDYLMEIEAQQEREEITQSFSLAA